MSYKKSLSIILLLLLSLSCGPHYTYASENFFELQDTESLLSDETAPCIDDSSDDVQADIEYPRTDEEKCEDQEEIPADEIDDDSYPAADPEESDVDMVGMEEPAVYTAKDDLENTSDYTLKIVWLDGGTRTIDLDKCQNASELTAEAQDVLRHFELLDRCNISMSGNTAIATVIAPKTRQSNTAIIAHTGYYRFAPENTLSSIRMAAAYGYTNVEFDIQFTKDGIPVLTHDDTLFRYGRNPDGSTVDPSLNIKDLTYNELQYYDFGIRRGHYWRGEKAPTLDSALAVCKASGLKPHLDIKWHNYLTDEMIGTIAALVEKHGLTGNVCYLSESTKPLYVLAAADPDSEYTYIANSADTNYVETAEKLRSKVTSRVYIYFKYDNITESVARTCRFHSFGITTTVNSVSQITALDKWVNPISTTNITPERALPEAAKRSPYSVRSYSGAITEGKDFCIYTSGDCGASLHMTSSRPGKPVVLGDGSGIAEMNDFRFRPIGDNTFMIVATRCMYALGLDTSGGIVLREPDASDPEQLWFVEQNADRTYTFTNSHTGQTLQVVTDGNGKKLSVSSPTCSINERFYLALAPNQVNIKYTNSRYRFCPVASNQYSLGIKGGSLLEGANAVITKTNTSFRAQRFTIIYSGDGYYRIVNEYSGKCLEMKDKLVVQTAWNNKTAQRWRIVSRGNNSYTVENKTGGMMNVKGSALSIGRLINRANIYKASPYQRWVISAT